ncbi:uridine kinase [Stylonychia lemnae]|uniref:uridine/cytidine kinase n=1 Tax=Stylonychia lemnae TaxID=5949 RepID=A0A078AB25_STYLE|nr:uridine kinase [Stylonychia lemnae]|eukprot:CDW79076.1 uridine kinase [Stylonychia lemnae]
MDNTPSSRTQKPLLIGVTGGTASGKTSLCKYLLNSSLFQLTITLNSRLQELQKELDSTALTSHLTLFTKDYRKSNFQKWFNYIDFYMPDEDHDNANNYNFDHPNALDFDCAHQVIKDLLAGNDSKVPIYDFTSHQRTENQMEDVVSAPIVIFEGILSLYDIRIRDLMDLKIFVLTDDDVRLARRLLRDCSERGRTIDGVLYQYNRFVKKSYDEYIKPTMKYANIIVPFGSDNTTAIDFIVQNLRSKLQENINKRKPSFHMLNSLNISEAQMIEQSLEKDEEMVKVQKTLGFEIVDYAIEYIGFKKSVTYFEAGNQENYKLEIMIRQLINYESPMIVESKVQDKFFIQSPEYFYFQDALEQGKNKEIAQQETEIFLFYPELLQKHALKELTAALDSIQKLRKDDYQNIKVNVGVYFCSIWILQELKSHPLFKQLHIYTLSLNDKLREYPMLTVMEQYSENHAIWENQKKDHRAKLFGADFAPSNQEVQLTSKLCYKQFFESREKKTVIEKVKQK